MNDKINKSVEPFQEFLNDNFKQCSKESIEVLLMLAYGHMFDIFTPNQLIQTLNVDKNKVYDAINSWSIYHLRKLFLLAGFPETKKLIEDALTKSPATLSRMRITLCVDDTVVDRLGNLISLTYNWYSGKHHHVVKGQNIISITIKIGQRVIPLCIRPVGKQGRGNTSKPDIFRDMLRSVLELYKQEGIDLNRFPITFDSWYGSDNLIDILKEEGFDQIIVHAKSNYVFTIEGKKQKLSLHKPEIELNDSAWGCKGIPIARKEAESPTFGKVILVFFLDCSKVKCIMVFGRKLRASEAISIWKQHHSIEQFWRRLKHDLQIHRMRLQNRNGVYSMVGIKFLAYLVMEKLYALTGLTFQQIKNHAKREINICSFFREHFHLFPIPQRL
jgi:Transposase DDE domain